MDTNQNTAGYLHFVRGQTKLPVPRTYTGLDLGQRRDHSALACLNVTWKHIGRCAYAFTELFQPEVTITTLERFPLSTGYEQIFACVMERLRSVDAPQELVIDAGGPGPPMVDRFRAARLFRCAVTPVLLTGGRGQNTLLDGYSGIPRRTLISNVLLAIGAGILSCNLGLRHWSTLENELIELRGDTAEPGDSSGHDDLTIAVALALYAALRDNPYLRPGAEEIGRQGPRFGFIDKPLF
jgi:hypothetical protein